MKMFLLLLVIILINDSLGCNGNASDEEKAAAMKAMAQGLGGAVVAGRSLGGQDRQTLPTAQEIFNSYDKDGNGCLTSKEVSIAGGFDGCLEFKEVIGYLARLFE